MIGFAAGRWRGAALLALPVIVGGCELQRDPVGLALERDVPGVHSVLVAGEDRVRVLVVRFSREIPVQDGGIVPVDDAEVRLDRQGEVTTLTGGDARECVGVGSAHLVQTGRGCYTGVLPRPIATGDRFDLTVRFADGEVARGTAVIPGAPAVRSPAPGDTLRVSVEEAISGFHLPVGNLAVELTPPPDGALLEVGVETAREPFCRVVLRPSSVGLGTPFGRTSRTLRIRAADAGAFDVPLDATCRNDQGETEPVGVLPARLLALAYDTAYARWTGELAVNGQDLPLDAASAGLSGAVGYFAGAGRVAVPLIIVEE